MTGAERRSSDGPATATIVFTDLVGSTATRVELGEERADRLREVHDELLSRCVEANNGRVVKGGGDGLLAAFESATDALSAAVAMQQAADVYGRRRDALAPLHIRIGISTGDVSWVDGDCFGLPVVEAARLEAAAEGGQILCSELVRMLARGRGGHEFDAVGFLDLKGLPEPVAASSVQWRPELASPSASLPPALGVEYGTPLVGREVELAALGDLLDSSGATRAAWLLGEPGIGKSRLATEFARTATGSGALVLFGRCDEDLSVPYQPVIQALRWFVDATPDDELADRMGDGVHELTRLVPELAERLPGLEQQSVVRDDTERYRLYEAVRSWLGAAGGGSDVVLVVDDAHWATDQTLQLLAHLLRSADPIPLLMVATARTTETDLPARLVELTDRAAGSDPSHLRLELGGLDRDEIAELVGADRAGVVFDETAGNPLFVEALASATDEGGLPASVQAAARLRVGRLPGEVQDLLAVASVIGLVVEVPVLASAAGVGDVDALEALEVATRSGLFHETGPQRFRWAHALVRGALAEEMTESRRIRVHAQIATAIEEVHQGHLDRYLAQLAHHATRAVEIVGAARAFEYSRRAGDAAAGQVSYEQALEHYSAARRLLTDVEHEPVDEARLLLAVGRMQRLLAETADALDTLGDAVDVAVGSGHGEIAAEAAIEFEEAAFFPGLHGEPAVRMLRRALEVLPADDEPVRAKVLGSLARATSFTGDAAGALRLATDALDVAARSGDRDARVHTLTTRAMLQIGWLDFFTHPEVLEELDALTSPGQRQHGYATMMRWIAALSHGDIGGAVSFGQRMAEAAQKLGDPLWHYSASLPAFAHAILRADYAGAEMLAEETLDYAERLPGIDGTGLHGLRMFITRREQGRLAQFAPLLGAVMRASDSPVWRAGLCALHAELGNLDELETILDEIVEVGTDALRHGPSRDLDLFFVAEACAVLDRRDLAGTISRELAPLESYNYVGIGSGVPIGPVARFAAMMATVQRDFGAAERLFEDAIVMNHRLEAPGFLARVLHDRARMYRLREGRGDAARAAADLHEVVGLTERTGQAALLDRARTTLEEIS